MHSSIVCEHWGASPFLFRTLFSDLFDCLSPLWRCFRMSSSYLQSLDPQYSLISSKYSSLDMCIRFHSYFEKCNLLEELIVYCSSKFFFPFRQSMPMGEKFRGFKGIWFYAFVWFLSICLSCSCILAL